jgi:hypothetical protein
MVTVQEKVMYILCFFETKSIITMPYHHRVQYGEINLERTLSNVGYSSFKRLVAFCIRKEQEDLDQIQEASS